jgi:hypothetical protein
MGQFIGELLIFLLQGVFEYFFYYTAWLLLPLLSFGHWQVLPFKADAISWQGPSFQRAPDGKIIVGASMAAILGFVIWIVFIAVTLTIVLYKN